jgi:CIC family chloride channel protein
LIGSTWLTHLCGGSAGREGVAVQLGATVAHWTGSHIPLFQRQKSLIRILTISGMAAGFSGLFHAPLTAIFLIAEITGGYGLMIPLMSVASTSYAISKRFEKHSMDVKNLAKKGHAFTSNKGANVLSTLETSTIIDTSYLTISPNENLERLVDLISHSDQVIFPVVNEENELLGVVHFNDIREIIFNTYRVKYTLVKEIMIAPVALIAPTDRMEIVMNKFEQTRKAFLPVVQNGKYFGFISKSVALEAYRTKLKAMTID